MADKEDLEEILAQVKKMLEEAMGKPKPWEPWMDEFLRNLERSGGNATVAIDLSGLSRDTVYRYRRGNEKFARLWQEICNRKNGQRP